MEIAADENLTARQPLSQTGVSMIEVLIAILVSVIGLFSVMKLQITAVSNTHSSYFRSQAAIISNALIDQLRANSTSALAGNYDLTLTRTPPTSGGLEVDRSYPVAHRL